MTVLHTTPLRGVSVYGEEEYEYMDKSRQVETCTSKMEKQRERRQGSREKVQGIQYREEDNENESIGDLAKSSQTLRGCGPFNESTLRTF